METAVKLNINNMFQVPCPSITPNKFTSRPSINSVIKQPIIVNNSSTHITLRRTIEYNKVSSYIEGKVIDMNAEIKSEINKILKIQRNVYLGLFASSVLMIILSWIPSLFTEDVSIVLKPLSIAFSFMIALNYHLRRAK
ncbi:hypothetical protein NSA47_02345 [Irregularibacter muris]|uniref:Uncharacterized protein n=1 Tax=Irregularibacter muris TaxID=1796619 RepID=A0AAE3L386_9FIRM|nr:hypothetical protein [Irregularibacter muris]MCR1897828.1 hypothetical protein [Irregularibacter muris]